MPEAVAVPRRWGVGALLLAVGDALAARFGAVAVDGELSAFSRASSGHCYFTLKDADGAVVAWRWHAPDEDPPAPPKPAKVGAGELDGKITIAKLNVDENGNTAMKYGVRSIPTLIIFKDGEPAAMKVGAAPKSDLAAWIKATI